MRNSLRMADVEEDSQHATYLDESTVDVSAEEQSQDSTVTDVMDKYQHPESPVFSSSSSDTIDFSSVQQKQLRVKKITRKWSWIDEDSQPDTRLIRRPGKRGRPPRKVICDDLDDVVNDEPKDKLTKRLVRNENEKIRRDRLNTYVAELAHLLPMVVAANRKMEKSSILRLAVNYLRVNHDFVRSGTVSEPVWNYLDTESINHLIQECNGDFMIASSKKGIVTFVSQGLSSSLGHKLVDILGQSIFEWMHPDDHDIYLDQFNETETKKRNFCVRLIHNINSEQQHFVSVNLRGYIKHVMPLQSPFSQGKELDSVYLIAIGRLSSSKQEIEDFNPKLICTSSTFFTYHDVFGHFTYLDPRWSLITGYMPREVVGTNSYSIVFEADLPLVAHSHYKLLKDDVVSTIYRARNKSNTVMYLRATSHRVCDSWTKKTKQLISVNEVLSVELGKVLLKQSIENKKLDELKELENRRLNEDSESNQCSPDSTVTNVLPDTSSDRDISNPIDVPMIRMHLPRLKEVCPDNEDACDIVSQTDSLQPKDTCKKLSKQLTENSEVRQEPLDLKPSKTIKHIPHRLRSLSSPVTHYSHSYPLKNKLQTKALKMSKLSTLLLGKSDESVSHSYDTSTNNTSVSGLKSSPHNDNSSLHGLGGSCTGSLSSPSNQSQSSLDSEESSVLEEDMANIKAPQLPIWTRHSQMRHSSHSSLLYKMLRKMENEEQAVKNNKTESESDITSSRP